MQEALIFQQTFKEISSHRTQWEELSKSNPGLTQILDAVGKPDGTAIVFAHDDPDGITSGIIFKRMLERKGWKASAHYPTGFALQPSQFQAVIGKNSDVKAVFILDKGTLASYDQFADKMPVFLVDHHPTPQKPSKCVFFNPAADSYVPCSASILAHGISTLAGTRDSYDDFLALVGLKGDWAIEPVKGILVDFARPFIAEYGIRQFGNLFNTINERPTQFDAEQRDVTCLLSRIAEFVHATGGGGFQYFYNDRDPSLRDVDHPACIAAALEAVSEKADSLGKISDLESFISLIPAKERSILNKIFAFFLSDWDNAGKILDTAIRLFQIEDTSIYLFVGGKVPLLPMIGSIKLFELKSRYGDKIAQIIMASSVSPDYSHISVRGTGDRVHSGKICANLQDMLREKYPECKDLISGGGHPRAAECITRTAQVPFARILKQLLDNLSEMMDLYESSETGNQAAKLKSRAYQLGLEFLKP